jgi:hypothetical protein
MSTAEAVVRYAADFIPSWAGAISLDLMPAVLIFIHVIVFAAIRREEGVERDEDLMTAGEVMRAVRIYQALRAEPDATVAAKSDHGELKSSTAAERPPSNVAPINPALTQGRQQT